MAARGSLCLPHVRQTLAGLTKVLGRDEAAKKPPECAVVATAVASRVLLLLDDGDGHGEAGHRLVALQTPGFTLTEGAPTDTGGATTADTGGAVRHDSDDARTGVLAAVLAWSNSPLLIELNWSGELLNHAPAWGGKWLRPAKRGW